MLNNDKEEILKAVVGIFSVNLDIPIENINSEASIVDDLGASSLKVYEILGETEEVFEIEIPDNEIGEIDTIGQLVDYIINKR